ncbi:hypothetical protein DM826_04695 [Halonotius aquaticus]|uniref:High potential iron-sulfur proteins family profile domain-containing protein n=1 Tax=Halonotius aquaticus TaxID=2216978 RepID=A0A3A6PQF1_9EURY|nr:high-potential iron-sulfur protein [Halonotius aquaticus]RJX43980.1 hypothetical protein DM826_04695 [Halonotius aquaticus]
MSETPNSRRQFLRVAGAAAITTSLAGCGGSGGGTDNSESTTESTEESGGGGSESEPVPESERTAKALGGIERDPDALQDPEALNYQSTPNNGQQCNGCQYYVPDQNGDGMGACTLVSGQIDPEGWCISYAAYNG